MQTKLLFAFGGVVIGSLITYFYNKKFTLDSKEKRTVVKFEPYIRIHPYTIISDNSIFLVQLDDKPIMEVNIHMSDEKERLLQFINGLGIAPIILYTGINEFTRFKTAIGAIEALDNFMKIK